MNWTLDLHAAVPLWRPEDADPACVLAFSTRRGGVSPPPRDSLDLGSSAPHPPPDVRENRRRALAALGLRPSGVATAGQVHGSTVRPVSSPGHVPDCDALLTCTAGLALAVATADCLALLFTAPGVVAAAHAGWRGLAAGVPRAALRALLAAGAPPEAVHVTLGPCVRACCYEVGPDVARLFPAAAVRERGGRAYLDLPEAARWQLREAGLAETAVSDAEVCTACRPDLCFSYRRDGPGTGRLWGLVALRASTDAAPRGAGREL